MSGLTNRFSTNGTNPLPAAPLLWRVFDHMRRFRIALVTLILGLSSVWWIQHQTTPTPEHKANDKASAPAPGYEFRTGSSDGIGKFFHGREIAQVMGHPAIGWLEREERETEEAPSRALAALDLSPNTVIADIGAGSGYYSFRIAPTIPFGKVIAIDIQQEMLDHLTTRSAELNITNVVPHLGKIDDLNLEPEKLDAALMVDAYHEFSHPAEMWPRSNVRSNTAVAFFC
jgi:hypothetical protein